MCLAQSWHSLLDAPGGKQRATPGPEGQIAAGADLNAILRRGAPVQEMTILDMANQYRRTEFAALLLTHGAKSASEIQKV
ncbi:hypothetical protein DYH09_14485 [bacterium CPR1]|nr:hypothetical protein [bacterium CPR1]